jgi:hypothetical protein
MPGRVPGSRDIREGKLTFDEIMSIAKSIIADCERLKAAADLADMCNSTAAAALLREITEHWETTHRA